MKTNIIYKAAIVLLLPLILLLTTLEVVSFDTGYFVGKYEEYGIAKSTGISKDDLKDITDKLIDYLKNDKDNLDIEKEINGDMQQVFGEREVLHMVDVKELFLKGHSIRNISLILVILSFVALIIRDKKSIGKALILSSILSFISIFILFLLINTDFNKYFTYFHEIFFKNDLWLLDPKTDVLIQMLPLEFFYSIATKISTIFIIELILMLILGVFLNRRYKLSLKGNN